MRLQTQLELKWHCLYGIIHLESDFQHLCVFRAVCDAPPPAAVVIPPYRPKCSPYPEPSTLTTLWTALNSLKTVWYEINNLGHRPWPFTNGNITPALYPMRETCNIVKSTGQTDGSMWKWILVIAPTLRWSILDLLMLMVYSSSSNVMSYRVN